MKKLVYAGLGCRSFAKATLWAMLSILTSLEVKSQGCILTCPPPDVTVEVSLPAECTDILTYNDIPYVTLTNCPGEVTVDLIVNGNSIGNQINASMIGMTFMFVVTHVESGQACMGFLKVVDKQAPQVVCPADVTFLCNANLQEYNGIAPEDVQECSDYDITFVDEPIFLGDCQGGIISQYHRTYYIIDEFNNADTCEQTISLTQADIAAVEFPPSLLGIDALDCFPPPNTLPSNTGYPSIDGNDILNGTYCNLIAGYSDITVAICSGSYKIIRTWTVIDWCNNNQTSTATQMIEVLDRTKPIVQAPADFTMSTSALECTADVIVPAALVSEDCSTISDIRMTGTFGTIHSNGGIIPGLSVGAHQIIFIATTDCQLEGRDTVYVTVQDLQPPVPVCQQTIVVPVNNLGFATIPAISFNGGSYDNCGHVYFKVRRMTAPEDYVCANPGNPNNLFDDFVQLCCQDIENNPIMVILRVYDVLPAPGPVSDTYLAGHFNDCMVMVEVQDKLPPQIICPSDLTISCQFPFTEDNLDVFGTIALAEEDREQICIDDPGDGLPGIQCIGLDGLATDNCSVSITSSAIININMCGIGSIIRTFTATDDGGLTATCVQTISVINFDPFSLADITWPADFTTFNICEIDQLDPEDLDPPYNEPILNDGPCDLVGSTYHDDVFDFSNGSQACFKILRTWKVVDWCQLNTQYGGTWTHIQVLKVMNNIAPVIGPIDDITECSFDPQCGGLELDLDAQATDDCSGPQSLTWKYYIDLDNNNSFDFVSGEITGGSISFTRYFPIGTHRVLYSVWDRCGNITTEEQFITIESCKAPSAKCIDGLSTNLMAMDTDGDGEADWGMVVLEAVMFDAGSDQACGNPITLAFSSDPTDVTRVFDCDDVGVNEVELWAIDQNGLTDFCITHVDIQDNNDICPQGLSGTGNISGKISVPGSGKLANAMIYLEGSNQSAIPTTSDGYFVFPAMPFGSNYVVRPEKNTDFKNGVTTLDLVKIQKHLLGLSTFETPYEYIAADANNSESVTAIDIIQLRKLILGITSDLPNNKSWRFIDNAHVFADPHNPWLTDWAETYSIVPFSTSMNEVNFDAVKIGDVNRSASTQLNSNVLLPRTEAHCLVEYQVNQQSGEDVYRVDVYVNNAQQYQALQFSFDWDKRGYELVDFAVGELMNDDNIIMRAQQGEKSSVAAYTTEIWPVGKQLLFSIWVRSVSSINMPFQLFLAKGPTDPVAYQQGTDDPIAIEFLKHDDSQQSLHNNPNPFTDLTTIYFNSDREEDAVLRIYDLSGRSVLNRPVKLARGENEFVVRKSELKQAGVYVYEIESNFQYSTNRMIIVD